MSDPLNGSFGQTSLDPADPTQRIERLDRDSPDRDNRQQEEFPKRPRHPVHLPPGEDRVEISEAALRALQEAQDAAACEPPGP